jgi:hypothetical protein
MQKIELTVHEFMAIMGQLDEDRNSSGPEAEGTIYEEWYKQWIALDVRLEKLGPMDRADLLFDGKISINAISEDHFQSLIEAVKFQILFHKNLIDTDDEDADEEDLDTWNKCLNRLAGHHSSADWDNQD